MLLSGGDNPITAHNMVSHSFLQNIMYWTCWKQGSTSSLGVGGLAVAVLVVTRAMLGAK